MSCEGVVREKGVRQKGGMLYMGGREMDIGFRAVGAWFTTLYSPIETACLFVTEVAL